MIQKIDEIIDQYTPYSKSIPTWDREDIRKMMEEYADKTILDVLSWVWKYRYETDLGDYEKVYEKYKTRNQ